MDLATLLKPVLTSGGLRVVGSTTFDEYKQIEKDRALSRRFQKIALQEPTDRRDRAHPARAAEALRRASSGRLHAGGHRGRGETGRAAPARLPPARQRHRPDGRGRRGGAHAGGGSAEAGRGPAGSAGDGGRTGGRASLPVDVAEIEQVVARIANIPARQASSSDKDRLRTLEESLQRVVFGQEEAVALVTSAIKRARAGLGMPDRPAGSFLFTGPDRRGQDRTRQAARHSPGQRVHALRHERVHGEARRGQADRRPSGLRGLRTRRPAGGCGAPAPLQRRAARRDREGAPGCDEHPAAGHGPRDAHRQHRAARPTSGTSS